MVLVIKLDILVKLKPFIDNDYKKFHEKICSTKYEILGVKIPVLRKISKELLKEYPFEELLKIDNKYYESVMLKGMIIANNNDTLEDKINLITDFLPLIDNWAICDIFVSDLKIIKKHTKEFLPFINNFLKSDKEYTVRFGIICLIDYYINDDYIDMVLDKMLEIKSNYYYVNMAISWCLSICLIKYFDKTKLFLEKNKNIFDKWTYNKAMQKGIESFRISSENKEILKSMKIKTQS